MGALETAERRGISVTGLAVRRGGRLLFSGLDFAVAGGEAVLLRGPNGAGKSSLLLTLCGAVRPEAGAIAITGGGAAERTETALHLVGHAAGVKSQLSVAENLSFWADLYGGSREAVPGALERVGLSGLEAVPGGYLSAGQTRRLALARLLVAPRPIWLLDEPTAALDGAGEALVVALIGDHVAGGGIVIAATHQDLAFAGPSRTLTLGSGA